MSGSIQACSYCIRNCRLIHKHNATSSLVSFFKVLVNECVSKDLSLPPKIAPIFSNLVGRETYLEDSSGKRWAVKISNVHGSLAFKEGWKAFSLSHNLSRGHFLVFHYIEESHFVVDIFGKSGCVRYDASKKNFSPIKRPRINEDLVSETVLVNRTDKGSIEKPDSGNLDVSGSGNEMRKDQQMATNGTHFNNHLDVSESDIEMSKGQRMAATNGMPNVDNYNGDLCHLSTAVYRAEQLCMINRDAGFYEGGDRSYIYDLSSFENQRPTGVAGTNRVCEVDPVLNSQTEDVLLEISNLEAHTKAASSALIEKVCEARSRTYSSETTKIDKTGPEKMSNKDRGCEEVFHGEETNASNDVSPRLDAKDNVSNLVKTEAVDAFCLFSQDDIDTSCVAVVESRSFIELPTFLPLMFSRRKKVDRKVVLLRDPMARLWPVMYREIHGVKVLVSEGWEAFGKANCLQAGDKCCFVLESESESIYRVYIDRKQ